MMKILITLLLTISLAHAELNIPTGFTSLFNGKDPLVVADKPVGEWNHFRIIMIGENVTVYLNDKLVVDRAKFHNYFNKKKKVEGPIPAKGPIQLQTHGGEIRWKNIFIREISPKEAKDSKFK